MRPLVLSVKIRAAPRSVTEVASPLAMALRLFILLLLLICLAVEALASRAWILELHISVQAVRTLEESTLEFELSHQLRMALLANLKIVMLDLLDGLSEIACLLLGGSDQ